MLSLELAGSLRALPCSRRASRPITAGSTARGKVTAMSMRPSSHGVAMTWGLRCSSHLDARVRPPFQISPRAWLCYCLTGYDYVLHCLCFSMCKWANTPGAVPAEWLGGLCQVLRVHASGYPRSQSVTAVQPLTGCAEARCACGRQRCSAERGVRRQTYVTLLVLNVTPPRVSHLLGRVCVRWTWYAALFLLAPVVSNCVVRAKPGR